MTSRPSPYADSRWVDDPAPTSGPQHRWRAGLRRHHLAALLGFSLIGMIAVLLWLRLLATQPQLPGTWHLADAPAGLQLAASPRPPEPLMGVMDDTLIGLSSPDGQVLGDARLWLPRPDRWTLSDTERQAHIAAQQALDRLASAPVWVLHFSSGRQITLSPQPRGWTGLGAASWSMALLALGLYLSVVAGLLDKPGRGGLLYATMALMQCAALAIMAQGLLPAPGGLGLQAQWAWVAHLGLDAGTAAALVHLLVRTPRRLPQARAAAALAWVTALGIAAWVGQPGSTGAWWWINAVMLCGGSAGLLLMQRASHRQDHHPVAAGGLWLVAAGVAMLVVLVVAQALSATAGASSGTATTPTAPWLLALPTLWTAFLALLLMLGPYLWRARHVLHEFALLVGFGAAALLLHLLVSLAWPAAPAVAWAVTLALAVLVYAIARPVLARVVAGSSRLSAEHLFDGLYRTARGLEQTPAHVAEHLARLMREVFDPIAIQRKARALDHVRLARDGTAMAVPVPGADQVTGAPAQPGTLLLRHARQGQRLFTEDDRRLTERMLEQLRKAADHDRAVEIGRAEERQRIAQDLHDDIGARLLTLMYKAPNSEIEEYIRHTLQDLKTLTRGLAAANPRLSHAAAEWKADLAQRLNPTGADLRWSYSAERDITLNVVQWSAMTRVLRELVNNIISHARANLVEVSLAFDGRELKLVVTDDGVGRDPARWSHGLGLGGVRKRVRQLGGEVQWTEVQPAGIRCHVTVRLGGGSPSDQREQPSRRR